MTLVEIVTKKRAEHQAALLSIAKELNMDPVEDVKLLEYTLQYRREVAQCLNCNGLACRKMDHRYQEPVVSPIDNRLDYIPCLVGRDLRRLVFVKESNIPPRYRTKEWADYRRTEKNAQALEIAKWYANSVRRESLYLSGETGSGKTFLASLIGLNQLELARKVYFVDMPSLLSEIQQSYSSKYKGSVEQVLSRPKKAPLLILDDVGAGRITDWSVGILYEIVNTRYNASLPMVLTANYSLEQLGQLLTKTDEWSGKRILSRLGEMAISVELGDDDYRARGAEQ